MTIKLFSDKLVFDIPDEDWDFLCKNRFFSDNPPYEELVAEFVSSTGITEGRPHLFDKAGELFCESIEDLRSIRSMDINKMARDLLSDEEKHKKMH